MPTKKNFLGGQQNYNAKTGEYEPSLVGKNGQPVKDADGDGKINEKQEQDFNDPKEAKQGVERDFNEPGEVENERIEQDFNKTKKESNGKFKVDRKKYPDVETTPYGFIYNVNGTSIEDIAEHMKRSGMGYDPSKKYGFSVAKDGEEYIYETFEDAYNSVKGKR